MYVDIYAEKLPNGTWDGIANNYQAAYDTNPPITTSPRTFVLRLMGATRTDLIFYPIWQSNTDPQKPSPEVAASGPTFVEGTETYPANAPTDIYVRSITYLPNTRGQFVACWVYPENGQIVDNSVAVISMDEFSRMSWSSPDAPPRDDPSAPVIPPPAETTIGWLTTPDGTDLSQMPNSGVVQATAGVAASNRSYETIYATGTVFDSREAVWQATWKPVAGDAAPTLNFPMSVGTNLGNKAGVGISNPPVFGRRYGELTLRSFINGVPSKNQLVATFIPGGGGGGSNYGTIAFKSEAAADVITKPFWTSYVNTTETI